MSSKKKRKIAKRTKNLYLNLNESSCSDFTIYLHDQPDCDAIAWDTVSLFHLVIIPRKRDSSASRLRLLCNSLEKLTTGPQKIEIELHIREISPSDTIFFKHVAKLFRIISNWPFPCRRIITFCINPPTEAMIINEFIRNICNSDQYQGCLWSGNILKEPFVSVWEFETEASDLGIHTMSWWISDLPISKNILSRYLNSSIVSMILDFLIPKSYDDAIIDADYRPRYSNI
jgi:hypothetical protein